jgi:hypothetical protein
MATHYAGKKKEKQPLLINWSFILIFKRFAWPSITGKKKKKTFLIQFCFDNINTVFKGGA